MIPLDIPIFIPHTFPRQRTRPTAPAIIVQFSAVLWHNSIIPFDILFFILRATTQA